MKKKIEFNPKRPKVLNFKLTNSIDHFVKNISYMRQNCISLESLMNIACVDKRN